MSGTLSGLDLRAWYVGAVAGGIAILGVGAVAKTPAVLAIGVGLISFGIGEWKNHPYQERIIANQYGYATGKIRGHARKNCFGGLAFATVGIMMMLAGVVKVAISLFE